MARPKGLKNKPRPAPWRMNLSAEERIHLLANIILNAIEEDQAKGGPLLKKILAEEKLKLKTQKAPKVTAK